MRNFYTATFLTEGDTVYAAVPDLPGCISTGKDLPDAIDMITDAANLWLVAAEDRNEAIPSPTPQGSLDIPKGATLSMIPVDTIAYRAETDTRAVRKNVSLPSWMATLADKRNINVSQVLQDALMAKFA